MLYTHLLNVYYIITEYLKIIKFVCRGLTTKRKYGEIVMPLQGVTDVMKHFKNYTDLPHIAQLATEVNI